jgi:glycosyltransferase involved in cell wall biosynthesis
LKLIIQIPCLNEEHTLPATLAELPRDIAGIDSIEILVVDDGSTDQTVEIARVHGVHHVLRHTCHQGLGRAFRTGLDAALKLGADIIVNTDGDGQYCGGDIPKLIAPILAGEADIVVGDRQTAKNAEFSFTKKCLQWLGSYVVRSLSGTDLPDAVSGFRAISRKSAIRLNILSKFSYTVEMLIQAGNKQMSVVSVPVRTNPKTRESRLFASIPQFVSRQLVSMVRMYAMYRPMRFFLYLGLLLSVVGVFPIIRFLMSYFSGDGAGNIQSLILGGVLMIMGFMIFTTGLLSDLISHNRQLSEIALEKIRGMELGERTADNLQERTHDLADD